MNSSPDVVVPRASEGWGRLRRVQVIDRGTSVMLIGPLNSLAALLVLPISGLVIMGLSSGAIDASYFWLGRQLVFMGIWFFVITGFPIVRVDARGIRRGLSSLRRVPLADAVAFETVNLWTEKRGRRVGCLFLITRDRRRRSSSAGLDTRRTWRFGVPLAEGERRLAEAARQVAEVAAERWGADIGVRDRAWFEAHRPLWTLPPPPIGAVTQHRSGPRPTPRPPHPA